MTYEDKARRGYEMFRDPAYYDLWAVRKTGSSGFNEAFHVTSAAEAEHLIAALIEARRAGADWMLDGLMSFLCDEGHKDLAAKFRAKLAEADQAQRRMDQFFVKLDGIPARPDGAAEGE